MALRNYSNITNVGTLSGAVGTGETTLAINGGWSNLPTFPFYVIVDRGTANEECMLATGGNATALQVTRGYDGSPASSHGISATIEHAVLAEFFNKADAHVEASTNVHGLSGGAAVVGTTQTQTLTNKTINSSALSLAHSTSPAASQAVQVAADAATARDGFVWTKTAAATGAAFKATSSGVTRYTVDADGKVQLNSATATDKALSVTQSGTERLFIQNDGHTDFGLQAGGATTDRVRIRTQNTQNALAIKDSGGFNIFTIGGSGNVDASGYVATAGNLSVTGTSTLTGDVTLPLPAAGTTQRIVVNSRTGGTNFEGRNQAGNPTSWIRATGEASFSDKVWIFNGTAPAVGSVTNTGNVSSPSANIIVFDNSDNFIKRHNGTSWDTLSKFDTSVPRGFVGVSRATSNSGAIGTTETVTDTITFTAVAGRRYKLTADFAYDGSSAGDQYYLRMRYAAGASLTSAGTQFGIREFAVPVTGIRVPLVMHETVTGIAAGQTTIGISLVRASGAGTITREGAVDNVAVLTLEDVGV